MQFFHQQDYSRHVWASLDEQIIEETLKLVRAGKGVIPYDNILKLLTV